MENLFFTDIQSLIRIVLVSIIVYPLLIIILRISGKRTLSKMNAFDFIITIALGSTLATVILNKDVSLTEGLLTLSLLVLFQFIITYLSARNKKISQLVKSEPTLMAYHGKLLKANMLAERIAEDEIWAIIREKGFSSLGETEAVVLETDGSLTVITEIEDRNAQPVKRLIDRSQ